MGLEGDVFLSETTMEEQERNPRAWMVRPCEWYQDEARECGRLRARVHQHFVLGRALDCSPWAKDYASCLEFRRSRDPKLLSALIASEERRLTDRARGSAGNDVWKYRSSPPADWAAPLPLHVAQRSKGSLLEFYSKTQAATSSENKASDA